MTLFDDENIMLCINCDSEYSVTKYDDDEELQPEFCPFCGYHLLEDEDEEIDEDEDDDRKLF